MVSALAAVSSADAIPAHRLCLGQPELHFGHSGVRAAEHLFAQRDGLRIGPARIGDRTPPQLEFGLDHQRGREIRRIGLVQSFEDLDCPCRESLRLGELPKLRPCRRQVDERVGNITMLGAQAALTNREGALEQGYCIVGAALLQINL